MTTTYADETIGGRAAVRCTSCRETGFAEGPGASLRHSKRCDVAPRETVSTEGGAARLNNPTPSSKTERTAAEWKTIRRRARRGEIAAVLTDDEIVDAVAEGRVSVSDAMNRDF